MKQNSKPNVTHSPFKKGGTWRLKWTSTPKPNQQKILEGGEVEAVQGGEMEGQAREGELDTKHGLAVAGLGRRAWDIGHMTT